MFPGHWYKSSASSASDETPAIFLPMVGLLSSFSVVSMTRSISASPSMRTMPAAGACSAAPGW